MTDSELVRGARERLKQQLWALVRVPLALVGLALVPLQLIPYPLVLVTVGVPLLLVTNALVRRYQGLHRAWAGQVLGEVIPQPYREPLSRGPIARVRAIATDPATWREL